MNDESDMARKKKVFKLKSTIQIQENLKNRNKHCKFNYMLQLKIKNYKTVCILYYLSRL